MVADNRSAIDSSCFIVYDLEEEVWIGGSYLLVSEVSTIGRNLLSRHVIEESEFSVTVTSQCQDASTVGVTLVHNHSVASHTI